jgi:hypothetical protein
MNEERQAHAPLNGDSKTNLEAVEGLHDAACCASSFVLPEGFVNYEHWRLSQLPDPTEKELNVNGVQYQLLRTD